MTVGLVLTSDSRFMAHLTQELLEQKGGIEKAMLDPGIVFVSSADNAGLHDALLTHTPLFLRHMFPVEKVYPLGGDILAALPCCIDFASGRLEQLPPGQRVAV